MRKDPSYTQPSRRKWLWLVVAFALFVLVALVAIAYLGVNITDKIR